MTRQSADTSWALGDGLRYGALGAPLAFVALPLYVQWPAFAAEHLGLSLALVGALLLALRGLDALIDPWLGAQIDRRFASDSRRVWRLIAVACVMVGLGFASLFLPPRWVATSLAWALGWSVVALAVTYLGYSVAQIGHQAWGARLGGDAPYRARVVGAREAFALLGVALASVLPSQIGWAATAALLGLLLLIALALLRRAPGADDGNLPGRSEKKPNLVLPQSNIASRRAGHPSSGLWQPWSHREFRALVLVYVANGMASAIPATLVIFYIRDRLALPQWEGAFLLMYFVAAALSVPLWMRLVPRLGLVRTWGLGMALATGAFVFAAWLGAGDGLGFAAVCIVTGVALGADMIAPAALLTGVIQRAGVGQQSEGVWFGWWSLCTKLNLALAAGLALPLLQMLGYQSGSRTPQALQALVIIYALVPCAIKSIALLILGLTRWHETSPASLATETPSSPASAAK